MNESTIRKVLLSDIGLVISIVVFLTGVLVPYFSIKTDIALIQQSIETINTNHLQHMQDLEQQVKDLETEQTVQNDKIIANQEAIIKIMK